MSALEAERHYDDTNARLRWAVVAVIVATAAVRASYYVPAVDHIVDRSLEWIKDVVRMPINRHIARLLLGAGTFLIVNELGLFLFNRRH